MPTTNDGMPAASNAILARSASTLVGYVLMVFMDFGSLDWPKDKATLIKSFFAEVFDCTED